jgi:hypothetical protein
MSNGGPSDTKLPAISGAVHGGQSPIQAAIVNLYVTSNSATGYGQTATLIGTSDTDQNGVFIITPSANSTNCPAGQQAYLTSAAGYPTGSPSLANNSTLLMAALGDCANISGSTNVIINEVTTVAAAYALSGFMTTSANGVIYQANVSAPAANRATTGTMTAAAGLAHAFRNAATLANYASGAANTQTANITVGSTTVNGIVPTVEINTLGDILQNCVNAATGNSACTGGTGLFNYTPSISGATPTNTLQSMINLARNPYPSTTDVAGLFSLTSSTPAFAPDLTGAPPDWSLAIVYKGTPLVGPYDLAIDANDTVYQGASGSTGVWGLSAYGITTPTFTAGSVGTATRQIAPDALGNLWVTDYKTSVATSNLCQYSTSAGGAPTVYPITSTASEVFGVAVDKGNNVWVANAAAVSPNITELAYSAGTYTANYTATAPGGFEPVALTIDANQNIWAADYYTNGSLAAVLPNLTPAAAATYTTSGTTITPISATFADSANAPLGLVVDASGNAWYGITYVGSAHNTPTTTGIEEVIPTLTSSVITSLTPQSLIANATLGANASQIPGIDGAGSVYLPDNQASGGAGIHVYSTIAVTSSDTGGQVLSPPVGYLGCYPSATVTTCGLGTSASPYAVYNPREIKIDSAGSVWAGITSGGLTQLIGLGAPSWPLLQTGKPGLSPGLSAVTPLP